MREHKHEIVRCERCHSSFECKANAVTKCQCSQVQLTLNETQYISEMYDGCLCAACLIELKEEYDNDLLSKGLPNIPWLYCMTALKTNSSKKLKLLSEIKKGLKEIKEIREGKIPSYTMSDLFIN